MDSDQGKVNKQLLLKTKETMATGATKQSAAVLPKHNTIYLLCCGFSYVEGGSGILCWPRLGCNRNGREAKCEIVYLVALERAIW